jgi:hypothetical protein
MTMPAARCRPLAAVALLGCLLVPAPGLAADLEDRVAEIERLNITAPWRESAELIEALAAEAHALTPELRFRIDYMKARAHDVAAGRGPCDPCPRCRPAGTAAEAFVARSPPLS